MRKIILIPDDRDLTPAYEQYWLNFVWRVKDAIERDGLEAEVLTLRSELKPAQTRPRPAGW